MNLFKAAVLALAMSLGLGMVIESAEAARLGGGRSMGAQRSITQRQATPPAQQQAAQQGTQQQAQAAAGKQNRWLGPLAGLAAGLGLGWLFSQGGMGPMLLGLLVLGAAIALIMYMARQRHGRGQAPMRPVMAPGPSASGMGPLKYAGLGNETVAAPPPSQMPSGVWGGGSPSLPAVPAGFDSAGFLKQAKLNFIRLQEANDRADLQSLRDVTSDKLYEQLAADIRHRTGGAQHTDVVTLEAALLEVVTEGDTHWASVRFSGQISETAGAAPVPFAEVWHLSKPVDGGSGWLVAGIQQVS